MHDIIIDADAHVEEDVETWNYLDAESEERRAELDNWHQARA